MEEEMQKLAPEIRAIRLGRELKKMSRKDLALEMGISPKTIEKLENGRMKYAKAYLEKILDILGIAPEEFLLLKRGKMLGLSTTRDKKVLENKDRRSYRKQVTKECKALRSLRLIKGLSQDKASRLCGYARATIGHIENGRIELDQGRIAHIVKSYGLTMEDYYRESLDGFDRARIIEECLGFISKMEQSKLKTIHAMLVCF